MALKMHFLKMHFSTTGVYVYYCSTFYSTIQYVVMVRKSNKNIFELENGKNCDLRQKILFRHSQSTNLFLFFCHGPRSEKKPFSRLYGLSIIRSYVEFALKTLPYVGCAHLRGELAEVSKTRERNNKPPWRECR